MESYKVLWHLMEFYGILWSFMEYYGILWSLWNLIEFYGIYEDCTVVICLSCNIALTPNKLPRKM